MREWWSKICSALHLRRGLDGDLSDEMQAHLDLMTKPFFRTSAMDCAAFASRQAFRWSLF